MLRSPGLRLSAVGAAVFLVSLVLLTVLPDALAVAGMLVGGMGVWIGFMWTIFSYYGSNLGPPDG